MLRQIGAAELNQAVVAIGTSVEASVLTVSHLSDLGVPVIWAKALSPAHGRILERVGATRVVYPEREVGVKTAGCSRRTCSTTCPSATTTRSPPPRAAAPLGADPRGGARRAPPTT